MFYVHAKCIFLIFKFSKVMQQHTSCVVGNIMWVLLEIYCSLQQWKNFANPSRIDKVIAMVRVAPFFLTHSVYCGTYVKSPKRRSKPGMPVFDSIPKWMSTSLIFIAVSQLLPALVATVVLLCILSLSLVFCCYRQVYHVLTLQPVLTWFLVLLPSNFYFSSGHSAGALLFRSL